MFALECFCHDIMGARFVSNTNKSGLEIGHSKIQQGTGSSFKSLPIDKVTPYPKDHVEISHFTKLHAFRVNKSKL